MLAFSIFVLCLSAPHADASPVAHVESSELRAVAWRDQPRTRAAVVRVDGPIAATSELREPFADLPPAKTKTPTTNAAGLREPFAKPTAGMKASPSTRPAAGQTSTTSTTPRSMLREPFSRSRS